MVEAYRQRRLGQPSGRAPYGPTKPASINRELAVFKTIFSKAMKNGKAERNPAQGVKLLKENNERNRILSPEEYIRLLAHCPAHIKPIVKIAYHTGMRQGEILNLTWGQVDLREGFIHLQPEDCKTNEGRFVPLHPEVIETLRAIPRGLPAVKVFTYAGRQIGAIKTAFKPACKRACEWKSNMVPVVAIQNGPTCFNATLTG